MAFNNVHLNGVPPQQFPELWESSRAYSQRQGGSSEADQQVPPGFEDRKPLVGSQEPTTDLQRSSENGEPKTSIAGDDQGSSGVSRAVNESDTTVEDNSLPETEEGIVKNGPTWLNNALLMRQQNQAAEEREYINRNEPEKWCPVCSARGSQACLCGMPMHASGSLNAMAPFPNQSIYTHWLSMQGANMHATPHRTGDTDEKAADFEVNPQSTRMATELNLSGPAGNGRDYSHFTDLRHSVEGNSHYAEDYVERAVHQGDWEGSTQKMEWEEARQKALIVAHPLYPELLNAHAACLRVGTPVDQLPHIETQLAQAGQVTNKYSVSNPDELEITQDEKVELDRFMTQYIMLLCSFKETLQKHVYCDVTEAMMSCWELEQALHTLTGASAGESTGATMSDDEADDYDSDYGAYDSNMDPHDSGGFGPLVPTESERTLMERVRQELKYELKQGYRARIVDVREEILRKRRAGKLPKGTTTVLKAWWQAHAKWPYPTDEKEKLIQETGLELKQMNNWFINQRKRNWYRNPAVPSSSELKSKRKWRCWCERGGFDWSSEGAAGSHSQLT